MKTVCEAGMCAGCAACAEQCPKNAIEIVKGFKSYDAAIDENLCVDCDACRRVCPQNEPTSLSEPLFWKQGWAADEEVRANGASGGAATAIMRAFVERGGVACGCLFRDGDFIFDFAERVDDVAKFAGSKYVKSNPQGKLRRILDLLRSGRKVLFLGLPCQVAGLLNFIPPRWRANLYTVDLICHGTPSIELFKRYLQERGCELDKIAEISFRHKNEFALKREMQPLAEPGLADKYMFSFLKCLNYTPNCYDCRYAGTARGADLTLGDSWGSELPKVERDKGVSLILCVSSKGRELLDATQLRLEEVDVRRAVEFNKQLREPAKNEKREKFFALIEKGKSYDCAVARCYPKIFMKQWVKKILLRLKVLKKRSEGATYNLYIRCDERATF